MKHVFSKGLVLACLISATAFAGPYISGQINSNSIEAEIDAINDIGGNHLDRNSGGFSIGAGWQFNDYVALELSHNDLGSATDTILNEQQREAGLVVFAANMEMDATFESVSLAIIAHLQAEDNIDLFVKLGTEQWQSDISAITTVTVNTTSNPNPAAGTSATESESDRGSNLFMEIGAKYRVLNSLVLKAGYSLRRFEPTFHKYDVEVDINSIGLGLEYHFQ